jgi:hypothetical protein
MREYRGQCGYIANTLAAPYPQVIAHDKASRLIVGATDLTLLW